MKHFSDNDIPIGGYPKYRPSIICYMAVMTAFGEVIDEQELKEKVKLK